jgi:hypothetical protein
MADDKKQSASDDSLTRVIGWYDDAVDATMEARKLSERDRDYYDNKQLTDTEVSTLNGRGQPPVVINRIKPKVDSLLGLERQTRTDPKAFPRNPQDEQGAHAATDAIRFVCDKDRFQATRSDVFENIIVEGFGGAIVEVVGERRDIKIRRIPWDRIVYDPHSVEKNFSDAKYVGIVVWMDVDDAEGMYPGSKDLYESCIANEGNTYDDRPKYKVWADDKRKRIRLVEMYYRSSGKWMHCVFTKSGFAVEPEDSQYQDENGEPSCPIELQSCHVDRDNNRYGVVRQLIGPQDEINKRRSKALHLITTRQWVIEKGAVDSVQSFKKEAAKPDGVMVVNPGMRAELQDTKDMAAANLGLLQEAKQEIDAVGANAAIQGKDSNATSGKQEALKQQSAVTELQAVMDTRQQFQQAVYRQIWARVKQFWTGPMWIRITDDERNVKFVGLNTPAQDEMGQPVIDPQTGQPAIENNTAQLDVDITLEDMPDVATLQAEQFEMLTGLAKAYGPQFMPIDLLIEASSLRNKEKILERIGGQGQPGQQGPDPAMQQHAQQMMGAEQAAAGAEVQAGQAKAAQEVAKVDKIKADTALTVAKVQNEVQRPAIEAERHAQQMEQRAQQQSQQPRPVRGS